MPFDANGNYILPTIYIAIPGEVIKSTQHNTPFEDVQAALNNTLCRDGRTPWTGNQNANNNKLTGLAKGTDSTDAVRMDQVATLDGETDFTGKVTVQDVDDWTSNEPVPAKQADGRYVRTIDDAVNWPVQYIGISQSNNAPWFKSGPNYMFLQPAGDYATNSALTTAESNLQTQINGKQASGDYATNTALNNGLAGKENAGVCVTASTYANDFATSDSRVINLPYGHRIQSFSVSIADGGSITFPVAFSGVPTSIQLQCMQTSSRMTVANPTAAPTADGIPSIGIQIVAGDHTQTVTTPITVWVTAIGPK